MSNNEKLNIKIPFKVVNEFFNNIFNNNEHTEYKNVVLPKPTIENVFNFLLEVHIKIFPKIITSVKIIKTNEQICIPLFSTSPTPKNKSVEKVTAISKAIQRTTIFLFFIV